MVHKLIKIGDETITKDTNINDVISTFSVGNSITIIFERLGNTQETQLTFEGDPSYTISLNPDATNNEKSLREAWLKSKR